MCRGYFSSQEIDAHHATEHRSTDQSRNGCGMCCFCHAQPFEITRAEKIKSTLLQHSRQNAKVVEAFCHAACRLSNQCRPSIHQPPVDEFRMPAEMSIALSRAHVHARRLVLAPRPPSRSPPTYDPHSTRCTAGCHTSRDFVPWRFSDAGRRSAWIASSCRRPKTYTRPEVIIRSHRWHAREALLGNQCQARRCLSRLRPIQLARPRPAPTLLGFGIRRAFRADFHELAAALHRWRSRV